VEAVLFVAQLIAAMNQIQARFAGSKRQEF
jgi:hypothetical protein